MIIDILKYLISLYLMHVFLLNSKLNNKLIIYIFTLINIYKHLLIFFLFTVPHPLQAIGKNRDMEPNSINHKKRLARQGSSVTFNFLAITETFQ